MYIQMFILCVHICVYCTLYLTCAMTIKLNLINILSALKHSSRASVGLCFQTKIFRESNTFEQHKELLIHELIAISHRTSSTVVCSPAPTLLPEYIWWRLLTDNQWGHLKWSILIWLVFFSREWSWKNNNLTNLSSGSDQSKPTKVWKHQCSWLHS